MQKRSPLAVIQQDLLDGEVSTTRILQKCVLLANQIGSTELRDWAHRELNGYNEDIPDYRTVPAQILIDGQNGRFIYTGQSIGPTDLPDFVQEAGLGNEVKLGRGLPEIERLAAREDVINLGLPGDEIIRKFMNRDIAQREPFAQIHRVYWAVAPEAIQGVVEGVRTALMDLIGEMVRVMPSEDDIPPKEVADQALHFMNTGERSTIIINNAQASGDSTSTATATPPAPVAEESWWKRLRKRGVVITMVALVAGVAGVLNWLHVYPWQ